MNSELYGANPNLPAFLKELEGSGFIVGRILAEHKERYHVGTADGELDAEITGNLRFSASGREDFPCVGDWVKMLSYNSDFAIIHQIMPRTSVLKRKTAGKAEEIQLIAANVDFGLIMQAVDRDFNLNRIERYLTICYDSKIKPVIIINKIDLLGEGQLSEIMLQIKSRIPDVPVYAISNSSQTGIDVLKTLLKPHETYCLLGSSGVGKSTLINSLSGSEYMTTGEISRTTAKGKHVTTHRELIRLENRAILIDNPGMREIGIAGSNDGLEITFDAIIELSKKCRFFDCTHTVEKGCSVLEALENGSLDRPVYENFLKMEREKAHYESSQFEKRKQDKDFGKIMKNYKKDMKKNNQ